MYCHRCSGKLLSGYHLPLINRGLRPCHNRPMILMNVVPDHTWVCLSVLPVRMVATQKDFPLRSGYNMPVLLRTLLHGKYNLYLPQGRQYLHCFLYHYRCNTIRLYLFVYRHRTGDQHHKLYRKQVLLYRCYPVWQIPRMPNHFPWSSSVLRMIR